MSVIDSSFAALLPYLTTVEVGTLWVADENALHVLDKLPMQATAPLLLLTNRYDIYTLAQEKNITAIFNDFDFSEIPHNSNTPIERVVYRISKEKLITHHIFQEARQLLSRINNDDASNYCLEKGELIISGKKQEGVKSYCKHLINTQAYQGQLKKNGADYHGVFTCDRPNNNAPTAEQKKTTSKSANNIHYHQLQALTLPEKPEYKDITLYSKPGVFGWNKIDKGSELLLQCLPLIMNKRKMSIHKILDLGCGYGWIFANLPFYIDNNALENIIVTATDNNAAAIICAQKNNQRLPFYTNIVADDCAKNITDTFDIILCNPPFHQGFSHDKLLTRKFLEQTKRRLNEKGIAIFVVNEFVHLPSEAWFQHQDVITKKEGFKVITLS